MNNCNKFNIPSINEESKIKTHSWFDITEYNQQQSLFDTNINLEKDDLVDEDDEYSNYFTKKIKLLPTNEQKMILFKWLDAYTYMYNRIVSYIKRCNFNKEKVVFSVTKLKKMFKKDKIKSRGSRFNFFNKLKYLF